MPENLTHAEVNSKTDPSVAKQYDDETPKDQQMYARPRYNVRVLSQSANFLNCYLGSSSQIGTVSLDKTPTYHSPHFEELH
jgi:hypothetical protein